MIVYNSNKDADQNKMWFDARDPSVFEELYNYFTGQTDYMIPILSEENESPRSEADIRYSGARTFTTNRHSPATVDASQRGLLNPTPSTIIPYEEQKSRKIDILVLGDHGAGKKAFMESCRTKKSKLISKPACYEYLKKTVWMPFE